MNNAIPQLALVCNECYTAFSTPAALFVWVSNLSQIYSLRLLP